MTAPAYLSWPVPAVTREQEIARLIAENDRLPAGSDARTDLATIEMFTEDWGGYLLRRIFHAGRCAVCGYQVRGLIEDHDHRTGLVRGYLCASCNRREPYPKHADLFDPYRERPPAVVLGVVRYYEGGWGWEYGWWEDEGRARALTGNPGWQRLEQTP